MNAKKTIASRRRESPSPMLRKRPKLKFLRKKSNCCWTTMMKLRLECPWTSWKKKDLLMKDYPNKSRITKSLTLICPKKRMKMEQALKK